VTANYWFVFKNFLTADRLPKKHYIGFLLFFVFVFGILQLKKSSRVISETILCSKKYRGMSFYVFLNEALKCAGAHILITKFGTTCTDIFGNCARTKFG